jgi:hypothetical protein
VVRIIWFYPTESPVVQQVYIWKTLIGSPYVYFARLQTGCCILYMGIRNNYKLATRVLLDSVPTSNVELDFINNTMIIGDSTSKVNVFKE